MDTDLFRAILAMDAYNRGYAPGIKDLGRTAIGNAIWYEDKGHADAQAAGFYAVAYTLDDGNKVISYRGTDHRSAMRSLLN